jgi:hypothetical protein
MAVGVVILVVARRRAAESSITQYELIRNADTMGAP